MNYYNFSDLIIRLKWAYIGHLKSIKVKKNKFTIKFLYLLQKIGLIRGFMFLMNENNILIYFGLKVAKFVWLCNFKKCFKRLFISLFKKLRMK